VLDGRQYRSDQACGDPDLSLDPPCPETFDETRTMLGDEQEQWLLDHLAASTTTWQVIAQQTVFGDVTLGGAVLNYDQWDGYPAERNRIVAALDPAKNTVVLTGDIHFAGAGNLRQGERGTGTPIAIELVATSISSGGRVNPAVTEVVRAIPDIVDVELEHRGYILHSVTPEAWSAEYRMVETVKEVGAPMFVHATYVADAGTNTLRIA
jgi:alkaline phosphatase D